MAAPRPAPRRRRVPVGSHFLLQPRRHPLGQQDHRVIAQDAQFIGVDLDAGLGHPVVHHARVAEQFVQAHARQRLGAGQPPIRQPAQPPAIGGVGVPVGGFRGDVAGHCPFGGVNGHRRLRCNRWSEAGSRVLSSMITNASSRASAGTARWMRCTVISAVSASAAACAWPMGRVAEPGGRVGRSVARRLWCAGGRTGRIVPSRQACSPVSVRVGCWVREWRRGSPGRSSCPRSCRRVPAGCMVSPAPVRGVAGGECLRADAWLVGMRWCGVVRRLV